MKICLFLSFVNEAPRSAVTSPESVAALPGFLKNTPGLIEARLHTPAVAHDPMLDDGAPPALVIQLFFETIDALETACAPQGYLQRLARTDAVLALNGHAGSQVTQQAMLVRPYPVPAVASPSVTRCTYLVTYEGPADDTAAWLWQYLDGHPALMARLPGIRGIEIFSRLDWCGFLPWPRVGMMQRNQVVFDDPEALSAALNSPLRAEMREHFRGLPPTHGAVTHFPMLTQTVSPAG